MRQSVWTGFWTNDTSGGQQGLLVVYDDGGLGLLPDDDYYNGTIEPKRAIEIALAILKAARVTVLVQAVEP